MNLNELRPGDRVQTKIGTTGVIVEPTSEMPLHHLVLLDSGTKLWILRSILERSYEPVPTKKARNKK